MSVQDFPESTVTTTVTANGQTVQVVPKAGTPRANRETLLTRAQTALTNNQTFLAIASPTQAQAMTQVQALTRQANSLLRFTLSQFDSLVDS